MFRKKTQNQSRLRRSPATPSSGTQVFSYHANRSTGSVAGSSRSRDSGGFSRSATPKKASALRSSPPRSLLRRVPIVLACTAALVLLVNGVILSRTPEVIEFVESDKQRIFLRSHQTYQHAAEALLARSITNTNKLTIDTKRVSTEFQRQFPELAQVSVVLPVLGRRPAIYIQPSQPALLFKTGDGGLYVLDRDGRALINASQVPKVAGLGLQVVEDQSGLSAELGSVVLPSGNVVFITEVVRQLRAKGLSVTGLVLPKGTSELDVRIDGVGYAVKFNLQGDARAEVGSYLAVKNYLEREHKVPGSYVDVRVDNRAYYR